MKGDPAFAVFRAEFLRCMDVLALHNWDVSFKGRALKDAYAEIEPDLPSYTAVVRRSECFQ